jgi:hypothetical protein
MRCQSALEPKKIGLAEIEQPCGVGDVAYRLNVAVLSVGPCKQLNRVWDVPLVERLRKVVRPPSSSIETRHFHSIDGQSGPA